MNWHRTARNRSTLLAVLFCLAHSGELLFGQSAPKTPQDAARGFYRVYGRMHVHGIPDEKQRQTLSPYLSADLVNLLARTQRLRDAICHHVNPPNTPPGEVAQVSGYEGDLFTSNTEYGAKAFALGQPYRRYGVTRLLVYLTDYDSKWNDELVFRQIGTGWVIDNIEFTSDRRNDLYGTCSHDLRQTIKQSFRPNDQYRGERVGSMLR